jgi:Rrf2 family protein
MQITRQADYALRTMLFLARLNDRRQAPTFQISDEMQIPKSFLAKIISQLSNAGLVRTVRGAKGGVKLEKSTDAISIYEVVIAIDGPLHLNECTEDPKNCPFGDSCPIHLVWCETESMLVDKLKHTTLTHLLEREAA